MNADKPRRKGKEVSCAICGRNVYRKPSHVKSVNFCSQRCFGRTSKIGLLSKKINDEEFASLIAKNASVKEIAEKLGVSKSTVYRNIKKTKEKGELKL